MAVLVARWNLFVGEPGNTFKRVVDDPHEVSAGNEHQKAEDDERDQPVGVHFAVQVTQ